jgi:hypothetical protein
LSGNSWLIARTYENIDENQSITTIFYCHIINSYTPQKSNQI